MADPKLQSGFLVTATIAGVSQGTFMTFSGGDVSNTAQEDRPDGINPIPIPGPTTYANVRSTRTFDADRDTAASLSQLDHWAKIGAPAVVARQPRDGDGNPKGKARVYSGILIHHKGPDTDANSTTKSMQEIEIMVSGVA